jgi:hypothetical protein
MSPPNKPMREFFLRRGISVHPSGSPGFWIMETFNQSMKMCRSEKAAYRAAALELSQRAYYARQLEITKRLDKCWCAAGRRKCHAA